MCGRPWRVRMPRSVTNRERDVVRKLLAPAAWLVVALVATGSTAAQESASPVRGAPCPAGSVSEQYGTECGTPAEGADAARDAADDSWHAAGAQGGAKAFGEAVEAAGVGNAPQAATPSSSKEESGIDVLPETGGILPGISVLPLAAGVLLTAGGLLGFGTASTLIVQAARHRIDRFRSTGRGV